MSSWSLVRSILSVKFVQCCKNSPRRSTSSMADTRLQAKGTMILLLISLIIAAGSALTPLGLFVRPSQAAQPGFGGNPAAAINLQADKLSSSDSGNLIEATGNVEVKRE